MTYLETIVSLAAQLRLPAVYPSRDFVAGGGLLTRSDRRIPPCRRLLGRILKGEKPADLPVQTPTKYELVINVKAAKALGLTIPPNLLALADEVIE